MDLGATFVGVTTRFAFTLRNLALLPIDFHWGVEGEVGQCHRQACKGRLQGGRLKLTSGVMACRDVEG